MNPTIDRSEINRQNAQLSTGPKTEAGKRRSSLNALRHGLTGQVIVLPSDDLNAYLRHSKSFVNEYKPQGPTEQHLVQTLADTAWRQNRVSALETNLLTLPILEIEGDEPRQALLVAKSLESQSKALNNLSLHGQRLHRQFEKTLATLRQLQSERKAEESKTPKQAAAPVQQQAKKEQSAQAGFVFSKPEIDAAIHAKDRAEHASATDSRRTTAA